MLEEGESQPKQLFADSIVSLETTTPGQPEISKDHIKDQSNGSAQGSRRSFCGGSTCSSVPPHGTWELCVFYAKAKHHNQP